MSEIKFKIAAKTDTGLVRTNNEDNFQVASDLCNAPMKWVNDEERELGDKGALLVVADGMGGMNAGEIASEIAIETIKEFFAPEKITEQVMNSSASINSFMKNAIVEADKRIKKEAKNENEHRGMGTTIVVAWLLKDKLHVAWCGDSRAYLFNRKNGLRQITKDHSYVQTLVDKGKISRDDAFDFPDSNIITRSLSDSSQKARPDVLEEPITVCNDDVILLCTDGLCGMIRNHEIEHVLMESESNMSECADSLIKAACEAAGEDNITVALCKIVSGCGEAPNKNNRIIQVMEKGGSSRHLKLLFFVVLGLLLSYWLGYRNGSNRAIPSFGVLNDSSGVDTVTIKKDTMLQTKIVGEKVETIAKVSNESKTDTVYVVKAGDELSSIMKKTGHSKDSFDILRKDSPLIKNGIIVSNRINENDTLRFKQRKEIRK